MKVQKIAESTLEGGISISAILDTRHLTIVNNATIAIRVTFQRKCWYYDTGISIAVSAKGSVFDEYAAICNARGSKGKYSPIKMDVIKVFEKIKTAAQKISDSPNGFSLILLQQEMMRSNNAVDKRRLFDYWVEYGESKVTQNTRD